MASAVKRRKIDDQSSINHGSGNASCPQLPFDAWIEIAKFLPTTAIHSLHYVDKQISKVPSKCKYHLKMDSGVLISSASVENEHREVWVKRTPSQMIRMLTQNQVASLTLTFFQKNFPDGLYSALVSNSSCQNLRIIGIFDDENTKNENCNKTLQDTLNLIANKQKLKDFTIKLIQAPQIGGNLTLNNELLDSLFNVLTKRPLKTLKLDIETTKGVVANSLAGHLQNLNLLEGLQVTDIYTSAFWKSLKNHPSIQELYFPDTEINEEIPEEDKAIISNAISTLPQLKTLKVFVLDGKESSFTKYCIGAFTNSVPQKLQTLKIRFFDFSDLTECNISDGMVKAFFENISNSKSSITTLEIQDRNISKYLAKAPWKQVRTTIEKQDLYELKSLNERTEPLCLFIDYAESLGAVKEILSTSIFPKYSVKYNKSGHEDEMSLTLQSKENNQKITVSSQEW